MEELILIFAFCFTMSSMLVLSTIRTRRFHIRYTCDSASGPQKIHQDSVPRIGGVSLVCVVASSVFFGYVDSGVFIFVLLASIPGFASGFADDLFKSVSPSTRLIASIISAVLIITLTDALVVRTGIEIVDNFISSNLIAALLTALCLVSMCHAINIIDGLNGLAGLTAVLCFSATCIIAYEVNDVHVVLYNLVLAATTLGFVIFNFPKARIFLGDGGAYFLGLMIGFLAIILPLRNPVVHPFASMLIVIYPCYELGRSIVRRWRNRTIMTADGAHLHSLTYKLVARNMDHRPRLNQWLGSNAIASLIVLAFPTMNALIAVFFSQQCERSDHQLGSFCCFVRGRLSQHRKTPKLGLAFV